MGSSRDHRARIVLGPRVGALPPIGGHDVKPSVFHLALRRRWGSSRHKYNWFSKPPRPLWRNYFLIIIPLSEAQSMRFTRIALLSAATCLLPFATPAIAELGHPSGCASCEPVEVAGPTQGYDPEGGPGVGPLLNRGVPPGATALAPETVRRRHPLANGCHVRVWDATYPREYHVVCR